MKKTIRNKGAELLISLLLISLLLFSCFYFLSGDSSSVLLGDDITSTARDAYKNSTHRGFWSGYITSMISFFTLNWGKSMSGESVRDIVLRSLGVSSSLAFYAFLFSFPFSLFLSLRAVRKQGGMADRFLAFFSALFLLLPSFLTSIILVLVFSSALKLFPVAGYVPLSDGYFGHLARMVLPSLSISFINTSYMLRLFRKGLGETITEPYVTYARAKGVKDKDIVLRSVLKPSLPVIISTTAMSIISFFASSTVVETVFALPGMGRSLVRSALERDYSLSFVLVMIMMLIISLVLFISSLLINIVDRRGEKENGKA